MDRTKYVSEKYAKMHGLPGEMMERDYKDYDMSQRLRLADMVAADDHKTVADLGSQKGGMSHALKECGVEAISLEYDGSRCENDLKKVNPGNVVRCDAFHPPFKRVPDAVAVSYMFLGWFVPEELAKGRTLADIFSGLSPFPKIYSAELQFEYSSWFADPRELKRAVNDGRPRGWFGQMELLEPQEIKLKLEGALPDWEVEDLGNFGARRGLDGESYGRLGFRLTRKGGGKHG